MNSRALVCSAAVVVLAYCLQGVPAAAAKRPNVVLILTDNHAAWTLGCYGNPDVCTPNIDRLAGEGVRLTRSFAVNAVCSPTRASLLTGLIPSQHGVHCYLRAGGAQVGPDAYYTLAEFRTLPEILHESGYVCGMVGKWHLGDNLHPQDGFGYWITMPHGATSTFYDAQVIEDGQIRKEPKYLTDLWTEHAEAFIRRNKDRPFFLYLPYNGPYGLGGSLLKPARNRYADYYADKQLASFPREPMHPWLFNNKDFLNNVQAIRRYAAEISGLDDGVGRVMDTLRELDLEENTLVIFTGDQGLACGQNGIWGMGDHTRPLHTFDPGINTPMIYRQPGRIPAGTTCDLMTSTYDVLPTVLGYLGLKDKMAAEPESPGRDYSAALSGRKLDWDNVVFYEFENTRMIRTADWKYTRRIPEGPDELYGLAADPEERRNLAGLPDYAEKQNELSGRLDAFFSRYADPKFDLWHGGNAKSRQILHPEITPWRPDR
jgi:arylsulfatase A-like enzyme